MRNVSANGAYEFLPLPLPALLAPGEYQVHATESIICRHAMSQDIHFTTDKTYLLLMMMMMLCL